MLKPSLLASVTNDLVARDCKSDDFSKEVFDFLAKVVILVMRSDIFEQKMLILLRRCDSDLAKP